MRFIPQTNAEVIASATQYFQTAKHRCEKDGNCVYLQLTDHGPERCVVGAMIEIESEADEHFLRNLKGGAHILVDLLPQGFLPSQVRPALLSEIQKLHDRDGNWNFMTDGPDPRVFEVLEDLKEEFA